MNKRQWKKRNKNIIEKMKKEELLVASDINKEDSDKYMKYIRECAYHACS